MQSVPPDTCIAPFQEEEEEKRLAAKKKAHREGLIETYHRLQKQKKDLRKRNLQAQTNIAQYMRKHGIQIIHGNPFDFDRSQASLREEYNQLLNKVNI